VISGVSADKIQLTASPIFQYFVCVQPEFGIIRIRQISASLYSSDTGAQDSVPSRLSGVRRGGQEGTSAPGRSTLAAPK